MASTLLSRRALARFAATLCAAPAIAPQRAWGQDYARMALRADRAVVGLVPLGPLDAPMLGAIAYGLRAELGVTVNTLPSVALPASARTANRRRYRAELLLDFLRPMIADPVNRVLGVTEQDISTTAHGVADWGILGLGDLPGPACVISLFRCRRNARSPAQVRFRMVTTCVHEVGHTLGLDHCSDTQCLMTDARGAVATIDHTSGQMCNRCRRRIGLSAR
ncbi:MAG: matrixin family metalloprotease [Deltaproteobacteria bacterium]|nr:matrixin family metalloprotease [Deltaproteobacteria bacterium]